MTVKELIAILENYEDDFLIVMSKDSEGNSFSPLSEYCTGYYVPDCSWAGEFSETKDSAVLSTKAICLWPVN